MIKDRDQSTERVGRVPWTELGIGSFAFEIPTEYQYYEFDESIGETHNLNVNGVYEISKRCNLVDEYIRLFALYGSSSASKGRRKTVLKDAR